MLSALKHLNWENWYKFMIVISFIILVIALIFPLQFIPNAALGLMAFGWFLIGMGEWVNHPTRTLINTELNMQFEIKTRCNCLGGILTVIFGVLFFLIGGYIGLRSFLWLFPAPSGLDYPFLHERH